MVESAEQNSEPKFKWTNRLEIGVREMDDEHKVLIDHMNRVYEANAAGHNKVEILESLRALLDYSKSHFADEEKYMDSIQYPELKVHKQAHEALIRRLEDDYRIFENGGKLLTEGFFSFLGFWLKTHIHAVDTKYGQFVKRNK